jgi:hypothetical protein
LKSGIRETEQAEFTSMIVVRFLLRFLLVPLGAVVATGVALLFIVVAHWNRFAALIAAHTDPPEAAAFILLLIAPMLVLSIAAIGMMSPAAIGVLIAEVFAIRSWMFHVANGGLSAAFGWFALEGVRRPYEYFDEPLIVIGAGIAAGFAYWAVAGWNAGFWKLVFEPPPPRRAD